MGILCFQVDQIPDLSLNKYQSLADTGIEGVLKRHENFLRQWHGICNESSTSFHLLYMFVPSEPIGKRLKLFFVLQGNPEELGMIQPLLKSSPLSDFYEFKRTELPNVIFESGATLTKKERVADIFNPLTSQTTSVHYVPKWEMNEEARLYDLFRIYHERTQKPFTVQIAEWMPPDIDYDIATDVQLYNHIAGKPTIQRAVTSAFRNWQDKCMFTVDDRLTALQQRYLATKATDVSEMMACKCEKLMLLAECEMLQKKCERLERLWMKGDMKNSLLRDEFSEIFSYIENMTARVRGIQIIE